MDPKQLALQHFDKALLGAAVIWLGLVGANFAGDPAGHNVKDQLQTDIQRISEYTAAHKADEPDIPDWKSEVRKSLSAEGATASPFPGWALHNRPNVVYSFVGGPTTQDPAHGAPVSLSLRPERGKITVTWEESAENVLVKILKYEVERRVGASGSFETVAEVGPDSREFVDTNVSPRKQYYYQVKSFADIDTDHPVVSKALTRGVKIELKDELKEIASSSEGPVKTPRVLIVVPTFVKPPTQEEQFEDIDAPARANVKVYKWDPDADEQWVSQPFYEVKEGEEIGKLIKRRSDEVDFRAGKLKKATVEQRPHPSIAGATKDCYIIEVEYEDGSTETFNSFERPDEIKDVK